MFYGNQDISQIAFTTTFIEIFSKSSAADLLYVGKGLIIRTMSHYKIPTLSIPHIKPSTAVTVLSSLCHQFRARLESAQTMPSDQALYCWLFNSKTCLSSYPLLLAMDSSKCKAGQFQLNKSRLEMTE